MDIVDYRKALASFPTGVTVVAALDDGGAPWGVTANSFTSVSLSPPIISVCIGKQGRAYQTLAAADRFAINILSHDQRPLALHFAGKSEDRFSGAEWRPSPEGQPFLPGAAAHLECAVQARIPASDHEILLGQVTHYDHAPVAPLGYCRGVFFAADQQEVLNG